MMTHTLRRFQQRGATLIVVALGMGMALAAMMALDIGNLVWQKRELQKIADLAALAGATQGPDGCVLGGARANAQANGLLPSDVFPDPVWGEWRPGDKSVRAAGMQGGNACQVSISRTVPYFFMFNSSAESRTLHATAIGAAAEPLALLSVRSSLVTIDSRERNLLNAVIGGLLGGKLDISLAGWRGLAAADVNLLTYLDALAVRLGAGVVNYEELLDTELQVGELVDVLLTVVRQNSPTASATIEALRLLKVRAQASPLRLRLGQLLGVESGASSAALNLSANVLSLVQALVQIGNGNNGAAAQLEIPLIKSGLIYQGVKVWVTVVEKPQWKLGNPNKEEIFTRTAQIKLSLGIELLTVDVDLDVTAGGASARLKEFRCEPGDKRLWIETETSLLKLALALNYGITNKRTIGPVNVSLPGKVSKAPLEIVNPSDVSAPLKESDWRKVEGNYEILKSVGVLISDLIAGLESSNGGGLAALVKFLGWVLTPITEVLKWIIGELLSPLLDPILNELLKILGVDLAAAEVAGQLTCGSGPAQLVY